jgi:hypothetical protein
VAYQPIPIKTDDAAFTPGTDKLVALGYMADEASTDSVDENDIGIPRMGLDRIALSRIKDGDNATFGAQADAAAAGDTTTASYVALFKRLLQRLTTHIGQFPTSLGANTAANSLGVTLATDGQFVTSTGSLTEAAPASDTASSGLNGRAQRIAQRITSLIALLPAALVSGRLDVNLGAAPATLTNQGDVAHDGVDSGNPIKVGGTAIAHGTNPTAVAAGDRTTYYANRAGVPFQLGGHPNIQTLRANYTGAQTDAAIVTIATGLKIVVTRITVTAHNANSVNVSVVIGFATATTPTTTAVVAAHPGIPAGGGFSIGDGSGMLGVGADNEDLRITSGVPTGGSIDCVVSYFTVES